MPDHASFIRVATLTPKPGEEQAALELCKRWMAGLRGTDGCFGAQVTHEDKRPGTLTMISRWRDADAFSGAMSGEQMDQTVTEVMSHLSGPPEVREFTPVEE